MRNTVDKIVMEQHFQRVRLLPPDHPLYIPKDIARERRFVVACNYAYDVEGDSPVPDHIYEHAISCLELYKEYCPDLWKSCEVYYDYFVLNDDWEYTGSGVPATEREKKLADYLRKKWNKPSLSEQET